MLECYSCHYDITDGEEREIANGDGGVDCSVIRLSKIEGFKVGAVDCG